MHTIISKYCSEEWQDFVKFHSQQLSYKAGENIFNIGDPTEGLYFISSGKIKILTTGVNDTERIIRLRIVMAPTIPTRVRVGAATRMGYDANP